MFNLDNSLDPLHSQHISIRKELKKMYDFTY